MKHRKSLCMISITFVCLQIAGCANTKSATLKKTKFEFSVNHELPTLASDYFDNCNDVDKIVFRKSNVNVKKIGHYRATIAYNDKDYEIGIDVKDKEKPIIKLKKDIFVIALHHNYSDVKKQLNKNIMVTDNYDSEFPEFTFFKELPTEEKEIHFPLQVKDTSGNISDVVIFKVQFTKDGKAKSGLKQECKDVEVIVGKEAEHGKSNQTNHNVNADKPKQEAKQETKQEVKKETKQEIDNNELIGSDTSKKQVVASDESDNQADTPVSSNHDTENENRPNKPTEKPNKPVESLEPPRPNEQPKPEKPLQKPQLTVASCPDYLKDGYAKIFATQEEAYTWWNTQYKTEGSPYYGMQGLIVGLKSPEYDGIVWGVGY